MITNILFDLIIFIVALLIAALLVKKEYSIERPVAINKARSEVFNYIKLLKNQDNYSKWVRVDPTAKKDFRGIDGTRGFVYAWDGNKQAGKGEQEIKNIIEGERIDVEIRFEKPFKNVAEVYMVTESLTEGQTKVTWSMKGKTPYPMNIINLFVPNMLGKDLDISLQMLKNTLEK